MLYDDPPHRVDVLRPITGRDAGGGTQITYSVVAAAVPCSIDTMSSTEVMRFAAAQIQVTHTIGFRADVLPVNLMPGDVLRAADTGARYKVVALRAGRPYGTIPALVYAIVDQLL
jgi:hypothetical protein